MATTGVSHFHKSGGEPKSHFHKGGGRVHGHRGLSGYGKTRSSLASRRPVAKKTAAKRRSKTTISEDFAKFRATVAARRAKAKKEAPLKQRLKSESKAVRNYVLRAVKAGATASKAIQQGRILDDAGRIDDTGRLKVKGGRLSKAGLKRLLRVG